MKEDLAIARNSLLALQAENLALRRNTGSSRSDGPSNDNPHNVLDQFDPEMAAALTTEKKKRQEVERELELQVNHHFSFQLYLYVFLLILGHLLVLTSL